MTLPNILTILRIFLTAGFVYFLNQEGFSAVVIAFFIFVLASITDFLDGYIAKRYNLITNFGKIMDPIADKFLMLSAFFMFMQMNIIFGWMFVIICVREVGVTLFRFYAMGKGAVLAAEKGGKLKTVFQIVTAVIILLFLMLYRWEAQSDSANSMMTNLLQMRYLIISGLMLITVYLTLSSGISTLWRNRKVFA